MLVLKVIAKCGGFYKLMSVLLAQLALLLSMLWRKFN